jgi:hypothetical protein
MPTERVPDGQDVVAFLDGLAPAEGTWVSGVGALTDAVLSVPTAEGETERGIPGRVQLISLSGPATGPLMAVVAVPGAGTPTLEGGRFVSGASAGVVLHTSEAAAARAGAAPVKARPAPARASDDDEAEELPRYGDRVHHHVFGLCDVMVVREERMKIRDASGTGRLREIHLGAMKVLKPTVEDGHRVFKLVRKGQ